MTERVLTHDKKDLALYMSLPIVFLCIVSLILSGCSGRMNVANTFPETQEEFDSKRLSPRPGRSLVYFYLCKFFLMHILSHFLCYSGKNNKERGQ